MDGTVLIIICMIHADFPEIQTTPFPKTNFKFEKTTYFDTKGNYEINILIQKVRNMKKAISLK